MKAWVTLVALSGLVYFGAQASETVKGAKKDIETFKQEMNTKIDEADKEIAALKEAAKQKTDAAKEQTIKDLEATREKLRADLKALKEESGSKWAQMKKSFADSVDRLNSKVQKALKE
ncbi:MAG: hypothetical protein KF799_12175 [Bdellovibrionales bacterium]|nr:hypothetical protein [Bdellovibrionales bacterium]